MANINTWSGLESRIMLVTEMALKDVLIRIEEIVKDHIDIDVYRAGSRTNYYVGGAMQPTFTLRDSVRSKITTKQKYYISGGIYHDKAAMAFDPDEFVHGSRYWKSGVTDIRDLLPQIINDGLSGSLFGNGWWENPRPYLDNSIRELEQAGKVKQIFLEVFRKYGFKVN